MLRDMEELLNTVQNEEAKTYLKEALNCYQAGSFKACVVMSVNAGAYDLHQKVKALAESDKCCRELDDEIERKKRNLEVYEKYLFEKCASSEIDMLNSNELKELIRCLDTRNDCAHPSNFYCSPEKARDVYSSIIDIVSSKRVLFGCAHMKKILEEMSESTFFPVRSGEQIRKLVNEKIERLQKKAIKPFLKEVIKAIVDDTKSKTLHENALLFLAFSEEIKEIKYEEIIDEFISKDEYLTYLLILINYNIKILNYFSEYNVEKVVKKLADYLNTENSQASDEIWKMIILSEKMQEYKYAEKIAELLILNSQQSLKKAKFSLIYDIIAKQDDTTEKSKLYSLILEGYRKNSNIFTLERLKDWRLRFIIRKFNDAYIYENWLNSIADNICQFDFNNANNAVSKMKEIDKELWIDKVSEELKKKFLRQVLFEASKSYNGDYWSHDVYDLAWELPENYPELHKLFMDDWQIQLNDEEEYKFAKERYSSFISKYIVYYEEKVDELIDLLISMQERDSIKPLIEAVKEQIKDCDLYDDERKEQLLGKINGN